MLRAQAATRDLALAREKARETQADGRAQPDGSPVETAAVGGQDSRSGVRPLWPVHACRAEERRPRRFAAQVTATTPGTTSTKP